MPIKNSKRIFPKCKLIELPTFGDVKVGKLSVAERKEQIGFVVRRVYFIYSIGDLSTERGPHAHKSTEQIFVCVNGAMTVLLDNGKKKKQLRLTDGNQAIYIGAGIWHGMSYLTKNSTVLALASRLYDEADYLRDYDEFLDYVRIRQR